MRHDQGVRPLRRAALLAAGAVLATGAVGGAIVLTREPAGTPPAAQTVAQLAPTARTPVDLARASCVHLRLAAQGVLADSSAEMVRTELAATRVLAAAALAGDGRWAALSGGVAALDEAIARDDPTAAALGLQAALAACPP